MTNRRALAPLAERVRDGVSRSRRFAGLPASRTAFIGRRQECDGVLAALEDARLVTLLGPGGVGKTRLATVVAEAAGPSFPRGGGFVDLVPVRDGFVAEAVAAALGVTQGSQQPLEDAIIEQLGHAKSLLVLDNCEHLIDAAARFVDVVLSACPDARMLITSRERLAVPGERIVAITPLPLASDAQALFRDRATAADRSFEADAAVVAEICSRLDGMPLAIELAAARSASLGADGLLAALDDTLRVLAGGRGADERHHSVRSVIDWSHDLLSEDERVLLRRLAVFVGSFDLAAAMAVSPHGTPSTIAEVLGRLVDKSLVVHLSGTSSRWRLLDTIRAFALEQLRIGGEQIEVQHRHLRWATAAAADLQSRLDGRWRDDFDLVADDMRAALASAAPGPGELPHRLARTLGHLTYARRFLMESLGHYERAARHAPTPAEAARDLSSAADCAHVSTTSGGQAFELLLSAAEQAHAVDDNAEAVALARAVEMANRHPATFPAEIPHERLCQLFDRAVMVGDPHHPVVAARLATASAWNAGSDKSNPNLALAEKAVVTARTTGDPVLISAALDAVSFAAKRAGRLRDAHHVTRERLALLATMDRNDPYSAPEIVDTFRVASDVAIGTGDLRAALSIARLVVDDDLLGGHSSISAAELIPPLVLTGDFDSALRYATKMWEGWERVGRPVAGWMSPAVSTVALAYGLTADDRGYRRWRARLAQLAGTKGADQFHTASSSFADARVAVHTGAPTDAHIYVERAFVAYPGAPFQSYARAAGAELAVVAGLPDAAQRLSQAEAAAAENDWAAACLARASGRQHNDAVLLAKSIEGWERIGARFERACTLLLLPDRVTEGRAELAALGSRSPAAGTPFGESQ